MNYCLPNSIAEGEKMIDNILLSDKDFTIELFCRVDDQMRNTPKHAQANLSK